MKEVEKKDVPAVTGGQAEPVVGWLPIAPVPIPGYPPNPAGPTDPNDPLGDAVTQQHVKS